MAVAVALSVAHGGWLLYGLTALALLVAAWCALRLVQRPAGLVLDGEGIQIMLGARWRRLGRIRWEDIARAEFVQGPFPRIIELALTLDDPEKYLGSLSAAERAKLTQFHREAHVSVVVNGLDAPLEHVAALIRKHVASRPRQGLVGPF
ncbi:hypothetical protein HQ576_20845 [bacterium]|nr:hypothetical protein [bacterium]